MYPLAVIELQTFCLKGLLLNKLNETNRFRLPATLLARFKSEIDLMGLSPSGTVPLALPGGAAQASQPAAPAATPLLARAPAAKGAIAFQGHKKNKPAFWKESKKAFKK